MSRLILIIIKIFFVKLIIIFLFFLPYIASEVNTVPNGSLTMSKLRASKSMQNLEQITRDSFYNLKDLSSNLRQKYNSRMELRQQSQMYNELWDDDEENEDICYRRNYDDY